MASMLNRAIAMTGSVALLAACSHGPDSPAADTSANLESKVDTTLSQPTPAPTGEPGQEHSQPADDPSAPREESTPDSPPTEDPGFDPGTCVAPVPGAYPCAGRGIPAEATELTNTGAYGITTLMMPSRNIGCDVYSNGVTCVVDSWATSLYDGFDPHIGGYVTAGVGDSGPAQLGQGADVPSFTGANPGAPAGEILPYGTVWYVGDYVFSSAKSGLTFWNARTGEGALIKRAGFYPFSRN